MAEWPLYVGIHKKPHGGLIKMNVHHGVAFLCGNERLRNPNAFPWATGREFFFDQAVNHETVVLTVDIQVDAARKKVVVVHAQGVLGDELTVGFYGVTSVPVAGTLLSDSPCLNDSGCSDSDANRAILLKSPIQQVVVVANHGRGA